MKIIGVYTHDNGVVSKVLIAENVHIEFGTIWVRFLNYPEYKCSSKAYGSDVKDQLFYGCDENYNPDCCIFELVEDDYALD